VTFYHGHTHFQDCSGRPEPQARKQTAEGERTQGALYLAREVDLKKASDKLVEHDKCLDRGEQLAQNLDETLFLMSASEFCAAALLSEDKVTYSGLFFDIVEPLLHCFYHDCRFSNTNFLLKYLNEIKYEK